MRSMMKSKKGFVWIPWLIAGGILAGGAIVYSQSHSTGAQIFQVLEKYPWLIYLAIGVSAYLLFFGGRGGRK